MCQWVLLQTRVPRASGALLLCVAGGQGFEPQLPDPESGVLPIKLSPNAVGASGFEPPTSSTRTMRATKLRYAPITKQSIAKKQACSKFPGL